MEEGALTDEMSANFEHWRTDEWLSDLASKKKAVVKANKILRIQAWKSLGRGDTLKYHLK